jgi:hypothetical protein
MNRGLGIGLQSDPDGTLPESGPRRGKLVKIVGIPHHPCPRPLMNQVHLSKVERLSGHMSPMNCCISREKDVKFGHVSHLNRARTKYSLNVPVLLWLGGLGAFWTTIAYFLLG